MRKLFTLAAMIIMMSLGSLIAQDQKGSEEDFTPHGAPILKVFTNFNSTWKGGRNLSQFEITRAYLGYEHTFTKNFSGRLILDVGDPGVGGFKNVAYLKNAFLKYKVGKFSASFGMIPSNQFEIQEKIWRHRYIMKSFQDEYKFGPSADLGLIVDYQIADFVSVDAAFMNGEGYKLIQLDTTFKASVGATFTVFENMIIRGYYDITTADTNQQTIAAFVGWNAAKWSVGGEYNLQLNHFNNDGHDLSGFSFYGSYEFNKHIGVYGRYDYLESSELEG
ncbi:MAG TPA: hypothetical protein VK994_01545, partial [Bacteroidales bacterium]|nr:hypothetical protein [Bacteroidales bacterium]